MLYSVECHYNVVTILHSAQQWHWENISQTLDSQKTPHSLPSWASYGVSFVRILEKIYRVIMAPWYNGTALYPQEENLQGRLFLMVIHPHVKPGQWAANHLLTDPVTVTPTQIRQSGDIEVEMYPFQGKCIFWFTCYWISFKVWMKNNQHWFRRLLGIEWQWGNDLTISQWWSKPLTYNGDNQTV